ncbi:unnamed protein product [Gadus morhua 'NCC']
MSYYSSEYPTKTDSGGSAMSWLLAVWISLGFLLACQATLYQTIQQHHVARPGRTDILTLGKSRLLLALAQDIGKLEPPLRVTVREIAYFREKYARLRCLVLVQGNGNKSGLTGVSDQTIDLAY